MPLGVLCMLHSAWCPYAPTAPHPVSLPACPACLPACLQQGGAVPGEERDRRAAAHPENHGLTHRAELARWAALAGGRHRVVVTVGRAATRVSVCGLLAAVVCSR